MFRMWEEDLFMRISKKSQKRILWVIALLAGIIVLNAVATFLITPYSSASGAMFEQYRKMEKGSLDMVYLGDSHCYEGIDPSVIDEKTGLHSFNMGTNAQSLYHSRELLEMVMEEHEPEAVVLALDPYFLGEGHERHSRPEAAFVRARNTGQPISVKMKNAAGFMFDPEYGKDTESVNYFFPWVSSRGAKGSWQKNVKAKISGEQPANANWNNNREPDGFKPFTQINDYDFNASVKPEEWTIDMLSEDALNELGEICEICRQHDAKLMVIGVPNTYSWVLRTGPAYMERNAVIKQFLAKRDVSYYDFNLIRPDYLLMTKDDFKDWEHCNVAGADKFSSVLADVWIQEENGRSSADMFFSDEEYYSSVRRIDSLYLEQHIIPGEGVEITATPWTGSAVEVEYAFAEKDLSDPDAKYQVVRPYGPDATFVYPETKTGTKQYRVYAKQKGEKDCECLRSIRVEYERF